MTSEFRELQMHNQTLLIYAAAANSVDCITLLYQQREQLEIDDFEGKQRITTDMTAIHVAADFNQREALHQLIKLGNNVYT